MAGIYVHIPFCRKRCAYCDFHFSTTFNNYRHRLIKAIVLELILRKEEIIDSVETIYFGGGTPSILNEDELLLILNTIRNQYKVKSYAEVTLEANPEDLNENQISQWRNAGINRLSIGLQSFKSEDLKWMNRAHELEQGICAVESAKQSGFSNISVDLIYGLPGLTLDDWQTHLQRVVAMGVPHISAYCLVVEKRTALNHSVKTGKIKTANEETQVAQFNLMLRYLSENGYHQYEISNFSKKGMESKHNTAYWQNKPYLGVGPSAHSFNGSIRRWNVYNNTKYYKGVGKNDDWYKVETLTINDKWNELFLTGLRTTWGVSKVHLNELGGLTKNEQDLAETLIEKKLLIETPQCYILSSSGKLQADGIATSFFRV